MMYCLELAVSIILSPFVRIIVFCSMMYLYCFYPDCLFLFLLLSFFLVSFSGAPYYDPDSATIMSSNAYACLFQGLGGAYQVRNPGSVDGSGSQPPREDMAESAAPNVQVDPVLEPHVENILEDAELDVEDDPGRPKKRKKSVPPSSSRKGKGKEPAIQKLVCDGQGVGPDGEEVRVGTQSLQDLAQLMIDIPTDQEMDELKSSGLNSVLKRAVGHWGYVSTLYLVFCCSGFPCFS